MQRGESIISAAMAVFVVLVILGIQQKWQPASLKEVASSAQEFIRETTGIRGQIPDIQGYERLKTFRLGRFRAALYRASPAPPVFAPGLFVVYGQDHRPVLQLETLEGSKDTWTAVYDYAGHRGLSLTGPRRRPDFARNLTGNGKPNVLVGQYSGGDRCCTTVTVIELEKDSAGVLGRVSGLQGSPFEGLELRKGNKSPNWEIVAHRPMATSCGSQEDAADVVAVYAYSEGQYLERTPQFRGIIEDVLRQNLAKWSQGTRTLQLVQTVAVNYAALGQRDAASRFLTENLARFSEELQKNGVDRESCQQDLEGLLANLPTVQPP